MVEQVLELPQRTLNDFPGSKGLGTDQVVISNIRDHDGRVSLANGKYLVRIRTPCNTYLNEIRCAHDQKLQGEICRDDPSGPRGPEGFSDKSRQGRSPKTDYGGRRSLS